MRPADPRESVGGALLSALALAGVAFGCGGGGDAATGPEAGAVTLRVSTAGESPDPDGYLLLLSPDRRRRVGTDASVTFDGLSAGPHSLTVLGAASNCSPDPTTRRIEVTGGETVEVEIVVRCRRSIRDRFVFRSDRSGSFAVYTMAWDGSDVRLLADVDAGPTDVTRDGTRILVTLDPDGPSPDQAILRADGTLRRVTDGPQRDLHGRFDPAGEQVVFQRGDGGAGEIYVVGVDGSPLRPLTDEMEGESRFPDWAPNGETVLFANDRQGDDDVYRMDVAGGSPEKLTEDRASNRHPRFSPKGGIFAMTRQGSGPDGGIDQEIHLHRLNGGDSESVTDSDRAARPVWIQGGGLMFTLDEREIYRINADGTGRVNLTDHPASDGWPAVGLWSAGG